MWLDVAKFVAIMAVMLNHVQIILYDDYRIEYFSFFNVSLFILVMGVTSFISLSKHSSDEYYNLTKIKIKAILIPYIVATIIYYIYFHHYFHLENIVIYLLHFNMSGVFYYVLLYIQLLIIAPVIIILLQRDCKHQIINEFVIGIVIVFIAYLTTNYSDIYGVFGAGGKLFGGTQLILLYVGMLFGKYCLDLKLSSKINIMMAALSIVALVAMWVLICTDESVRDPILPYNGPFGGGINPPGVSLMLMAFSTFLSVYFLCNCLDMVKKKTS